MNFYPRPPRGGRRGRVCCGPQGVAISIHALREEGDCAWLGCVGRRNHFYPRPPRGGRPADTVRVALGLYAFLSTPSARRATNKAEGIFQYVGFLSTPSARRATAIGERQDVKRLISIHALREEGDNRLHSLRAEGARFLSTPSARRATQPEGDRRHHEAISIHALREEGDRAALRLLHPRRPISIHALREEGDLKPLRQQ